jgi:autophagy-related protein 17
MAESPRGSTYSSPSASVEHTGSPLSVQSLISHLVAAKRSLSSFHHVHRATKILSEARSSIESTTALLARTTYLRRSLQSQLRILRNIHFELEGAASAVQLEFQSVIKDLDRAERKLASTLDLLQQSRVEDAFRLRRLRDDGDHEAATDKETLHDFIDETSAETLTGAMKDVIDDVQGAQHDISKFIDSLEDNLQSVNELLLDKQAALSSTDSDLQHPNISRILQLLENHAHEMAQGLESLVKHFDLCVTAVKHTEGAGDAALRTVNAGELPEGVDMGDLEGPAQPINEEERIEMLQVVENDAGEVDDVVMEIADRNADMVGYLEKIVSWRERSESAYNDVATAFSMLESISARLLNHVAEGARHASHWATERVKIEDGIAGMGELCETYDRFLHAYDRMIVEAARRKQIKKQMERVVEEAQSRLDQLYEDDLRERELFRDEQGEFLPGDIWEGLNALPPRFDVGRRDGEEVGSIPELPRKTVEEALRRLKTELGVSGERN